MIPDLGSARKRKHANTSICVFYVFPGSGTSWGPKSNPKAVFSSIITVLNFFSSVLSQKNGLKQNGFIRSISKKWLGLGRGGQFFLPKTPEYAQALVETCQKPNYVTALLSLPLPPNWHVTCDTCRWVSSLALTFWEWRFHENMFTNHDRMNEWMNEWMNELMIDYLIK